MTPTTEDLGLLAAAIAESLQLSAFWFSLLSLGSHTSRNTSSLQETAIALHITWQVAEYAKGKLAITVSRSH